MSIKSLIVSLFLGVLIFVFGASLGILYQKRQIVIQSPIQEQKVPDIVKVLSSKVIPSVAAYGKVTKIDGRNITLSQQSDNLTIGIRDDAKVYSFVPNATPTKTTSKTNTVSGSKQIDFKDIKIGDNLGINIKILPNGQIEGFSVVVLTSLVNPVAK